MIDRWKLYDLIYDKADKLLKQYNPCNIRTENGTLICNNKYMCDSYGESLCCEDCEYLGNSGCTTKCLACKVALCRCENRGWISREKFDECCECISASIEFKNKMYKLVRITQKYSLFVLRASKKETFER